MSDLRRVSRRDLQPNGPEYNVLGFSLEPLLGAKQVLLLSEDLGSEHIIQLKMADGRCRWFLIKNQERCLLWEHEFFWIDYIGQRSDFTDGTHEEIIIVD